MFILGSCLGSFLNVCIYRLPKSLSIVMPGSFCPKCNHPLKWYDNIPILGYIFLKGKCRFCKEKISLQYPAVEIIAAVLTLVLYIQFGAGIEFFKYVFFFSLCIVISFIDIKYYAIPLYLCFLGIMGGLFFTLPDSIKMLEGNIFDYTKLPIYKSFLSGIIALGLTYFFKLFADIGVNIYLRLRKKESIEGEKESLGLGDVDFMGMAAVFFGWKAAAVIFFIAPFLGIVYSIYALIFKKSHLIPYLPYLSLASLVYFFWGEKILGIIF